MRCVGRHGVLVNVGEIWVLGVSTGDEVLPEFETKHSLHIMCCSFVFWARRKQGQEFGVHSELRNDVFGELFTGDLFLVSRSAITKYDNGIVNSYSGWRHGWRRDGVGVGVSGGGHCRQRHRNG